MKLYAQIDSDNNLMQFVGFNTNANAVAHCQANPECLFIPTDSFGSPEDYIYDSASGEIKLGAND